MEDEIFHMSPIRPYEIDSLCEIKAEGSKIFSYEKSKKGAISNKIVS